MQIKVELIYLIVAFIGGCFGFAASIWGVFYFFSTKIIEPIKRNELAQKEHNAKMEKMMAMFDKIQFIAIGGKEATEIKAVIEDIHNRVIEISERNRVDFMLDTTPRFEFDANGFCITVNEAFGDLTGFHKSDCVGNGWIKTIHINEQSKVRKQMIDSFSLGLPVKMDSVRMHIRGKDVSANIKLEPMISHSRSKYVGTLIVSNK